MPTSAVGQVPKRTIETVKITEGESLGSLAVKYHTSVMDIAKLNHIQPNANLKIGQNLKVDAVNPKEYAEYQKALAKKDEIEFEKEEAQYKKQQAAQLKKTNIRGEAEIGKAYKYGYGDKYGFSLDKKNGMVKIKLKSGKTLGNIKSDFGIGDGIISQYNNMKQFKRSSFGNTSYDFSDVKKGTTISVPAGAFSPQESTWQKVKEFLGF